ncbi:uncharacterized protein LOC142567713 [Dermacentor variabilis]|uniref:uncharacterized protein LOC142567713 n=1 Tax=Dermacentor variabilis TaxID=34621 RepID=UPI003F5CA29E
MKTADQWRQFWKKEVYNSRHDAAVVAAEHRLAPETQSIYALSFMGPPVETNHARDGMVIEADHGVKVPLLIVVVLSAQDSTLPSSAQSLDGRAPSPQLTPTTAVQPVTAPADQATPRGRRHTSRVSVGDRPGTSGLSRTSQQQERCTPSRRPAAEDFLPEIAAGYKQSLDLAAEIKSEVQQLKDVVGAVATTFQQEAETMLGQSASLHRLAAATEALADSQARQATALERMAAVQENTLANESAYQARIVVAAERLAITGQLILQQVQWLSTVAPVSAEPPAK